MLLRTFALLKLLFLGGIVVASPWGSVTREGDFVYFFGEGSIEVFNLSTKSWSSTVALSGPANAGCVDGDSFYVAVGASVFRLDSAGSVIGNFGEFSSFVDSMFIDDDQLIVVHAESDPAYISWVDKLTGELNLEHYIARPGANYSYSNVGVAFAPVERELFGVHGHYFTDDIVKTAYDPSGSALTSVTGSFSIDEQVRWVHVFPHERLILSASGLVLNSNDLTEMGHLGMDLRDATFYGSDQVVIIHEDSVVGFSPTLQERGTIALSQVSDEVQIYNDEIIVFFKDQVSASGIGFEVKPVEQLGLREPSATIDLRNEVIEVDNSFIDKDGVFNVFSKSLQSLLRWNPTTFKWEERFFIPVRTRSIEYDNEGHALVIDDGAGHIRRFSLDSMSEEGFEILSPDRQDFTLGIANGFYFYTRRKGRLYMDTFQLPGGTLADSQTVDFDLVNPVVDQDNNLYYASHDLWALLRRPLSESGEIGESLKMSGYSAPEQYLTGSPIWKLESKNQVLSSAGFLFNGNTLVRENSLGNNVVSGVDMNGSLYTLKGPDDLLNPEPVTTTLVQKWDTSTFSLQDTVSLPGEPVTIFETNNTLQVMTLVEGHPAFHSLLDTLVVVNSTELSDGEGSKVNARMQDDIPILEWQVEGFDPQDQVSIEFFDTNLNEWRQIYKVAASKGHQVIETGSETGALYRLTKTERAVTAPLNIEITDNYHVNLNLNYRPDPPEEFLVYYRTSENGAWQYRGDKIETIGDYSFGFSDGVSPLDYMEVQLRQRVLETTLIPEANVESEALISLEWPDGGDRVQNYKLHLYEPVDQWVEYATFSKSTRSVTYPLGNLPIYTGHYRLTSYRSDGSTDMATTFSANVSIDWSADNVPCLGYLVERNAGYGRWFGFLELEGTDTKTHQLNEYGIGAHFPVLRVRRIDEIHETIHEDIIDPSISHFLELQSDPPFDVVAGLEWRDKTSTEWTYEPDIGVKWSMSLEYEGKYVREYRVVEVETLEQELLGHSSLEAHAPVQIQEGILVVGPDNEGKTRVYFSSIEGKSCQIEHSTDLKVWSAVGTNMQGDGTVLFSEVQVDKGAESHFFRIIQD